MSTSAATRDLTRLRLETAASVVVDLRSTDAAAREGGRPVEQPLCSQSHKLRAPLVHAPRRYVRLTQDFPLRGILRRVQRDVRMQRANARELPSRRAHPTRRFPASAVALIRANLSFEHGSVASWSKTETYSDAAHEIMRNAKWFKTASVRGSLSRVTDEGHSGRGIGIPI